MPAGPLDSPGSTSCKIKPETGAPLPWLAFTNVQSRITCGRTSLGTVLGTSRACRRGRREYISWMAVASPDLKAFLLATPFFGGLSDVSLDLLVSMLAERRFEAGATVVAEGEPGHSMFVVVSGQLVASKLVDSGRSIRMSDLGA